MKLSKIAEKLNTNLVDSIYEKIHDFTVEFGKPDVILLNESKKEILLKECRKLSDSDYKTKKNLLIKNVTFLITELFGIKIIYTDREGMSIINWNKCQNYKL